MTHIETRCHRCDRPLPTADQDECIPAFATATLCWAGPECELLAVDWRARALAAEAALEQAERDAHRLALGLPRVPSRSKQ